jgi:uncharacterized membrane protein
MAVSKWVYAGIVAMCVFLIITLVRNKYINGHWFQFNKLPLNHETCIFMTVKMIVSLLVFGVIMGSDAWSKWRERR